MTKSRGKNKKNKKIKSENQMKKALVVTSFGTSHEAAMAAIENIENNLKSTFSDYDFYRAFTSGMIIEKIFHAKKEKINTLEEVFQRLCEEEYEEVLCQPTHIVSGREYDKICDIVAIYREKFKKLCVGAPLLATEEDTKKCAEAVLKNMPKLNAGQAIVFMGHGTKNPDADKIYLKLEEALKNMEHGTICLGTIDGAMDFSHIILCLKREKIQKVYLAPFLIAPGEHVRRDLAGEKETSWKSMLEMAGYEVEVKMQGLGEYDEVSEIFAQHIRKISM